MRSLVFLRHGQTDWNKQRLCIGQVDVPLNETGRHQATAAAKSAMLECVSGIVCSPLARAKETGKIVSNLTGLPLTLVDELKECRLGVWEGQVEESLSMFDPWLAGETPDGAESWSAFCDRVVYGIELAFRSFERPLVVSHSGVLWALKTVAGRSLANEPPNGGLVEIELFHS
jgi:probable phosphoglycerate mutase